MAILRSLIAEGPMELGRFEAQLNGEASTPRLADFLGELAVLPDNDPLRRRWESVALARFSQLAPERAGEYVRAVPPDVAEARGLTDVLIRAWGPSDPASAFDWANGLPKVLREKTLYALAAAIRLEQLPLLDAEIEKMPTGHSRTDLRMVLASRFASETPAVAAAWAENLADSAERGLVIKLLLDEWSSSNAPEAIALARRLIETGQNADAHVIDSVIAKWNEQNPQDVVNWIGGLPDGALKTRSWTLLAASADSAGILAMAEYAARNSKDSDNSELVSAIGQRLASLMPAYAAEWAMQLPDPQARDAALSEALAGWAKQDAPAAAAFVDQLAEGPNKDLATVAIQVGQASEPSAGVEPTL